MNRRRPTWLPLVLAAGFACGCSPWALSRWSNARLRGMKAQEAEDPARATEHLVEAVRIARASLPERLEESLAPLAGTLVGAGMYEAAVQPLEELQALRTTLYPPPSEEVADTLLQLLLAYRNTGRLEDAARAGQAYIAMRKELGNAEESPVWVQVLTLVAQVYSGAGMNALARPVLEEAARLSAGEDRPPELRVAVLHALAESMAGTDDVAALPAVVAKLQAAVEEMPQPDPSWKAQVALLKYKAAEGGPDADPAAARAAAEEALAAAGELGEADLGGGLALRANLQLAALERRAGDLAAARARLASLREGREEGDPNLIRVDLEEAGLEEVAGDVVKAARLIGDARRALLAKEGLPAGVGAEMVAWEARMWARWGDPARARKLLEEATNREATRSEAERARSSSHMARFHLAWRAGDLEAAAAALEPWAAAMEEHYPEGSPELARVHLAKARLAVERRDGNAGALHARKAIDLYRKLRPAHHPAMIEPTLLWMLAEFHRKIPARGRQLARNLRKLVEAFLPEVHPLRADTERLLANFREGSKAKAEAIDAAIAKGLAELPE